jgi:serine/threonine protein kinase
MAPHDAESQSRASALHELYSTTTHTRRLLTTVTSPNNLPTQEGSSTAIDHDLLSLITTVCEVYRSYVGELFTMQPFNKDSELVEDGGTTCVVSSRAVSIKLASNVDRGRTEDVLEKIIVKRTRKGVLEPRSSAMRSFIAELRVRSHMPLRLHPNIVNLKGVAWDYEEGESRVPRPLLLEEFAAERSLTHFWKKRNLTRMPFKVKADLCLDVAHGILALHECGVVHGDIKPDNILIFPSGNSRYETFTAKLTDFGHSVFEFEDLHALPAFTKQYCAPEADPERNSSVSLTFDGMKRTDVYSYGLVVLSVVTGGSFLESFDDKLDPHKGKDEMAKAAMYVVEKQDRDNNDSDFDLDVLDTIFNCTIVLTPAHRSLRRCLRVLERCVLRAKTHVAFI